MPTVVTGIAEEGDDGLAVAASHSASVGIAEEGNTAGPVLAQLSSQCCSTGVAVTTPF
jgi:hypothetical protein